MKSQNDSPVTAHDNSENFYIFCRFCRKGFMTSEFLNGHTCDKTKNNTVVSMHKSSTPGHHLKSPIEGCKIKYCKFCNANFTNRKVLSKHLKNTHNIIVPGKTFNCIYCEQHFSSKQSLNIHMKSHVHSKYFCLKCTFACDDEEIYNDHMKEHIKNPKHECHLCGKKFVRQQQYGQHMMLHDRHSCTDCNMTFSTKKLFLKHQRSMHNAHVQTKKYACPVCEKLFARPKILQIHLRTHTGEKPVKCAHCQKSFYDDAYLAKHMKSIRHLKCINNNEGRNIEMEKPYSCSKCDAKFYHHYSLSRHVETTHTACESLKCPYCEYCTKMKTNLKRHLELHTDVKHFVCEICGLAFRASSTLKVHKLFVHSENREFICSVCSKTFKNNSDLQRHSKIHSENRPYKCYCDKKYKRMSHLKRHMISAHQLSLNKLPVVKATNNMNIQVSLSTENSADKGNTLGIATDESSCDDFSLPLSNYESNKTSIESKDSEICEKQLNLPSLVQHDSLQIYEKTCEGNVMFDKTRNTSATEISANESPILHDSSYLDSLNLSPKSFNYGLSTNNLSSIFDEKEISNLQPSNPLGDISFSSSADGANRPHSLPNLNFSSQTSNIDSFTPFSPTSAQIQSFLFTNDILSPSLDNNLNLEQNSPAKHLFGDASCILSLSPFTSDCDLSAGSGTQNFLNPVSGIDLWDTNNNSNFKNSVNELAATTSASTNSFSNYTSMTSAFMPQNLFTNDSLFCPIDTVSFNAEFDALSSLC